MIKVAVLYPKAPGTRFDHGYYRDTHLPLVQARLGAAFGPHAAEITADIANYTDRQPLLQISEVVVG